MVDIAKVAHYAICMKNTLISSFDSRQHMISKDFEIYYYSDYHMKNVKPHSHDYYEFYFFLCGNVSITVGDVSQHLRFGDIIFIPPNTGHYLTIHENAEPYRRFIFWISKAYFENLVKQTPEYEFLLSLSETQKYIFHFDLLSFNLIQSKLIHLIEHLHFDHFAKHAKVSLCIHDLLLEITGYLYEREHPVLHKNEKDLCQNVLHYIENHIGEDLSLTNLANVFFVSKYHIAHIFKERFGISVHQFILKKRLNLCKGAICSGQSITEEYLQYGFKDYSAFYRAFKKEFGMSPKKLRDSVAFHIRH